MAFFDRSLSAEERAEFTDYLSAKFGINVSSASPDAPAQHPAGPSARLPPPPEADARVVLSTEETDNVNSPTPHAIRWDIQSKALAPLRHDSRSENTRLYCERDNTRVRLHVSLPLITATDGTAVRLLIMKNYEEYLAQEASSGSLVSGATLLDLDATVEMQNGDFVEIVAIAIGAEGQVTLGAGAVLVATTEASRP